MYDARAHLGHARTYLQFDVIRRILRDVLGYDVVYVMNVTDVDDKIIVRSQERGITPEALAREWERKFLEDMTALGVEKTVGRASRPNMFLKLSHLSRLA